MTTAVCAAVVRPFSPQPLSAQRWGSQSPVARVDQIRQHFDKQRQHWDSQIQAKCTHLSRHQEPKGATRRQSSSDGSDTDSEKENQEGNSAALRLVSSDHMTTGSEVTWTVTYDIRDFMRTGSVEVHCDPDGIVVTASLECVHSGTGSLKRQKSNKAVKETFLIAKVDHSSLRVKSQPNGLLKITVSSAMLGRNPSKRVRAS